MLNLSYIKIKQVSKVALSQSVALIFDIYTYQSWQHKE